VFRRTFSAIARPILEFCVESWSPWLRRDIDDIGGIQRLASRMVHGLGDVPYHDRLVYLNVFSMEGRLIRGDLIEMFKLFNGSTRLNPWDYFESISDSLERRRHPWAIFKPHVNTTQRRNCFMVKTISAWNSLPRCVLYARNLDQFKERLDKRWDLIAPELV